MNAALALADIPEPCLLVLCHCHCPAAPCLSNRSQHRALLKDQIEGGLNEHVPTTWKMTCFSVAEAMPEDFSYQPRVKNEVDGDVSFEEVRWADYQEPNKQVCIARFAEANRQKHLQFEVSLHA